MEAATELAGFLAAHAVWCVADGETLIPLVGYETADGKRRIQRVSSEHLEEGVAGGKEWLARNPGRAARAVLVVDGFVALPSGTTKALILTIRSYIGSGAEITMTVEYRPASDALGLAVHRPRFLSFRGTEPDRQAVAEAFWVGIAKHENGAEIWNRRFAGAIDGRLRYALSARRLPTMGRRR